MDASESARDKLLAGAGLQRNETASAICGFVLATAAVGARIAARRVSRTRWAVDDWLVLVALLPVTGYLILSLVKDGIICDAEKEDGDRVSISSLRVFTEARHSLPSNVNHSNPVKAYFSSIICYAVGVVLTKTSILLFYNRIFLAERFLYLASWAIGAVVVLYNLALILTAAFGCIPFSKQWMGPAEEGTCIATKTPWTVLSVVNLVTDCLILTLPVKYAWGLHVRTTQKLQVTGVFLLGGIVCIFGAIRVVVLARVSGPNTSYSNNYAGIWSFVELSVGVVAACLPTLGTLVARSNRRRITDSLSKPWRWIRRGLSLSWWSGGGASSAFQNHHHRTDLALTDWSTASDRQRIIWTSRGPGSGTGTGSGTGSGSGSGGFPDESKVKKNTVAMTGIHVRSDIHQEFDFV